MTRASLKHWPAGEMERNLRAERKRTIDEARDTANRTHDVVERDGREYLVVRLEDGYAETQAQTPEIVFHRHSVQMTHDLARGTGPLLREAE